MVKKIGFSCHSGKWFLFEWGQNPDFMGLTGNAVWDTFSKSVKGKRQNGSMHTQLG